MIDRFEIDDFGKMTGADDGPWIGYADHLAVVSSLRAVLLDIGAEVNSCNRDCEILRQRVLHIAAKALREGDV